MCDELTDEDLKINEKELDELVHRFCVRDPPSEDDDLQDLDDSELL